MRSGPSILGRPSTFVAGVGECPDHRKARYRDSLASCWVSPVLAMAIAAETPRSPKHQRGDSAVDSAHEVREPVLGCAAHPRGTAATRIRGFGTHRVALSATAEAPT